MKMSRLANAKKPPQPEIIPPSAAHAALVDVLEDLLARFAGNAHPLVQMTRAIKPGLVRDLAGVPEDQIRKACREFADRFIYIANAGLDISQVFQEAETILAQGEEANGQG